MTLPVSKQMRYSQLFFHTVGSTSEFQLWEKNMIFPQLFRKITFFFLTPTCSDNGVQCLPFSDFILSFVTYVGLQHRWSLEKNKQSKNSPLKQDTDTVTFTKWYFSSNYLMARTFRAKLWKLCSVVRPGLGGISYWKKIKFKNTPFNEYIKLYWCLSGDSYAKQNICTARSLEKNICSSDHGHTASIKWSVRAEQLGRGRLFPALQGLLSCSCRTQCSYESYTHSHECSAPKPGVTKLLASFM